MTALPSTAHAEINSFDVSAVEVLDIFTSDAAAVSAWLQTKQTGSPHSLRAYKTVVTKFRTWLSTWRGASIDGLLLSVGEADATRYVAELHKDVNLKMSSVKHKVTILCNLYEFWVRPVDGGRQIVRSNPFANLAKTIKPQRTSNLGSQRSLSAEECAQVRHTIDVLQGSVDHKHYQRTLLIWLLASRMALRREEIAQLRANNFSVSGSKRRWILRIKGKGRLNSDESDVVVAPDEVVACIQAYRKELGLFPDPLPSDSAPLLRRLEHETSSRPSPFMTPEHISRIMKSIFRSAARDAVVRLQDTAMEQRLLQASIHWGRHTWFVTALQKHPIHLVSLGGRHRDIRTTQKAYVSLSEDDLAKLAD